MAQNSDGATKNVVLVHGGFVDGSGREDVYKILKHDGYKVSVVQNPTISLTGDVAATSSQEHRFSPFYAEGVGKFQPRVALWQPWGKRVGREL